MGGEGAGGGGGTIFWVASGWGVKGGEGGRSAAFSGNKRLSPVAKERFESLARSFDSTGGDGGVFM